MMNRFDYLEVKGNHHEVGIAIGTKFKDFIQESVTSRAGRIKNYDEYLKRTEPYFKATEEAFPKLIEELRGVAEAAGVPVADYFSINNREINDLSEDDHCTIAVSFGKNGAVVGHNEDWEGGSPNGIYVLKATIGDTTFLGLQYKITIPGVAATINNWGLTQCINDLNNVAKIGVPKNFVARAVLECKTLDEAEKLIRATKKASGFNHVLVQGGEVRNIEIAGDKIAVDKILGKPYVHTNHYLSPKLKREETFHTKSSLARYEKAKELIENGMSLFEMEALLSDTKNQKYPIKRMNATLGSFIAMPVDKKVYICYGPPDIGKFIEYV